MSKYQEAFARLHGMIYTSPFSDEKSELDYNDLKYCNTQMQKDFLNNLYVLQELVDKATPKKAIARRASWAYDLYCPVCDAWLSSTEMQDDNIELFCKCGQKIKDFYYE